MKRTIKALFIALAFFAAVFAFSGSAKAASWDPGRIIDDGKFTNKNSMSVADIQNFLNSKVPTCDTWHTPGSGSQGSQPPWVCLKDYNEGGKSAAQIIWEQGQNFGINPQVLLVTLQKENGLITDSWPYPWQYRTAMGFGCPDGAPCDAQWFGFTNQVYQAARHFRNFYDQNPNWYMPHRLGGNNIKWNPNSACGTGFVNIVTRGTSALYSYTPYQPNAAALNNLYGTGDGCSAYGNRNFWRDFNNWFGSTIDDPYNWTFVGQSGNTNLLAGQKATWTVSAQNTGTSTWYKTGPNAVHLGTFRSQDRSSAFCTPTWLACNRPAAMNETSVAPGGIATFTFEVQAPVNGTHYEYFNLVAEGITWMNDLGQYFQSNVSLPSFAYTVTGNSLPTAMTANSTQSATITIRNDSNAVWYKDGKFPVNIGTYNPTDRTSPFTGTGWINPTRPGKFTEASVAPGQTATYTFNLKAPAINGTYQENFSLVYDGLSWFNIPFGANITVSGGNPPPTFSSILNPGQSLLSGQSIKSPDGRYTLITQADGNVVLYSPNRPIWWTNTQGTGTNVLTFQTDSNLVAYSPTKATWNSSTWNRGGAKLIIQNDGNLVMYNAQGIPIWNTQTSGKV